MRVAVFLLFPATLLAATLVLLRSGPPVSGTDAGGDARSVRLIFGDQVKVYPVSTSRIEKRRGGSFGLNGGRHIANLEGDVERDRLLDVEQNIVLDKSVEAGLLDRNGVRAGLQIPLVEAALAIGNACEAR